MSPHDGDMDKYEMRRSALQDLIDGLGWGGVTKVAERLGKSPSYVSRMLLPTTKSGFKRIGEDTADLLDVAFPGWMRNEAKISESNVEYGITIRPDRRGIPIIDYIQAGKWREIADAFPRGSADEYIQAHSSNGPYTFALRIIGNSMEPEFRENDVIVIDPDVMPNPGDYVVARNHVEEATFKKYRPRGIGADGQPIFELVPLNEDYAIMRSDQERFISSAPWSNTRASGGVKRRQIYPWVAARPS